MNWGVDTGQCPFFGCLNPEGSFKRGDPDRKRAVKRSGAPDEGGKIESLHPGFAGFDEEGDLWGLRGQDVEERQHLHLLSTFPPALAY